MGWFFTGISAIVVVVLAVVFAVGWGEDRRDADACYALGGIPVQGDDVGGDSVTCIDKKYILDLGVAK